MHRVLLFGRAETRRRLIQDAIAGADQDIWNVLVETVRSRGPWKVRARCLEALGVAAGSSDQALAEYILHALSSPERGEGGRFLSKPNPPLTRRQREVARLVARRLSNREIADQPGLSRGTVRIHVQHLLEKFDVAGCAAIGTWVGQRPDFFGMWKP